MFASRSRPALASFLRYRPSLEPLEGRLLMAGLDVPQLSSRPGAAATIYLDFDGHFESSWGSFSNVTTPAYDRDGDPTTFSTSELDSIREVWTRVAEDFAPFNVNVTTVTPATFNHGKTLTIVVGGSYTDWYGTQVNGTSFVGGFTSSDPNVGYVFSKNLSGGLPRQVADQASHEAGHCFGLIHQSKWNGTTLQQELYSGTGGWAPIMGSTLFSSRTTWYNGTTHDSPTSFQDDMAIIGGATNGFGFVADDYADTLATAGQLPLTGSSVNLSGLIGQTGDQDVFKFTTAGGNLSFNLGVAASGANLDSVLELRDANGQVVTIANDTTSGVFTSALSANVAQGTYYLIVRSSGGYGNVGQYTLTGTVVPGVVTAPEISVLFNGADLTSGGSASFGTTVAGSVVVQTFTIQNLGNSDLSLTPLNGFVFPAGFSLATNLGATTLTPGQSTTFTVQLDATTAGAFGGTIHVLSNDSDEGSFDIGLSGTVTQPVVRVPETRLWGNGVELTSGDAVSFGSPLVGSPVTETFTIQNVGDGDLVLSPIDPSSLPAGFSLVQLLGATTLHPTDITTFVVQFDAASHGVFGGLLHVLSNDADEGSFDLNLSATATVPEIRVFAGSSELTSGDAVNLGTTSLGTPITTTFTIQNAGDGNLVVSGFDSRSLPAGYSLLAGFGNTTLAPGSSIILTVQLDATARGTFGGAIHVLSSDADEGSFDIALTGHIAAPHILINGSPDLVSGETFDLGTTLVGTPITHTFYVHNVGDADLLVSALSGATLPPGLALVNAFSDSTVAPGSVITFTVQLDAVATGSYGGVIHVLSNDPDTGSFDLGLHGLVTAPEIRVFAGGVELAGGDTFSFSAVVGAPVTQTFTVQNWGDGNLTVTPFAGIALPVGFTLVSDLGATTVAPGGATSFTIQFDASTRGSFGGTLHLFNSDADEASFDLVLSGFASAPQIRVFVDGTELSSGGSIDFGATQTGTSTTRTISVMNVGDAALVLAPIDPNTLPAGFSLVSGLSATTLAPGGTATFTVQLNATAAGSFSGVIHITSNASDEGSFALELHGVANDPPPPPPPPPPPETYVKTIDDGDAGFSATGNWHVQNSKGGFAQDIQFASKAEKNDKTFAVATWTFTGLDVGQYRVSITIPGSSSYASDAPFSVFDGTTLLKTVLVNERSTLGNCGADGLRWQNLGTFTIHGGTLVVQLTNRAGGQVAADAVKIERVTSTPDPNPPTPPKPSPDPHHEKDNGSNKGDHGDSHKTPPRHQPAHSAPQPAKSSTKPPPKHDDPAWLHGLAKDVAKLHSAKPHK
jgi:hypothetical protein